MQIGERIKRIREQRKWTQQELAERADVPYMTIYRLERGIYEDTMTRTGVKLARALGVSLDVLAGTFEDTLHVRPLVGTALVSIDQLC